MLYDQKSGSHLEFSNRTQPTPNPIRERSGRPDITHDMIGVQDGRKTSRSQEIDVNSFCEEPGSSERTGRPVKRPILGKTVHETSVIQTRSSEDRKDFNVEQTHERTGRPVFTHDVINVSDTSQTRSAHESETFNVEDEILRTTTSSSDVSFEHSMWNPLMELFFTCRFVALSCHFCSWCTLLQGRCSRFCMTLHRAPLPVECLLCYGSIATPATSGY